MQAEEKSNDIEMKITDFQPIHKIEFLYFEGCPSHKEALENLKAVLSEERIKADIKLIDVGSPEKAEALGFYGSPSIRIDGKDFEGKTGAGAYSCRFFNIDGRNIGVPTKEYIRERLYAISGTTEEKIIRPDSP